MHARDTKIAALVDLGNAAWRASRLASPAEIEETLRNVLGAGVTVPAAKRRHDDYEVCVCGPCVRFRESVLTPNLEAE